MCTQRMSEGYQQTVGFQLSNTPALFSLLYATIQVGCPFLLSESCCKPVWPDLVSNDFLSGHILFYRDRFVLNSSVSVLVSYHYFINKAGKLS